MDELIQTIVEDLTEELSITDENFDESVLKLKVKQAYREVKSARNYPKSYKDEKIDEDMLKYYSNIRDIALYDYNQIGQEFQSSHAESSVTMTFTDRSKLFSGIIPLSR